MTRTVPIEFRQQLLSELPALARNPAYLRLTGHILFGRMTDNGGVLVSQEILAGIERKEHELPNRNYSGTPLLEGFRSDVAPGMQWTEHSYVEGRAREISDSGLPHSVVAAVAHVRSTPASDLERPVYLDSGLARTPARQKMQREEEHAAAMRLLSKVGCDQARQLMAYLNGLSPNRFSKMLVHLPAALEAAYQLENHITRDRSLRLLGNISEQPQPLYGPSRACRTPRLFSLNESLCRLPRQVRKVLTQDWTTVDLKTAQLAIVGQLWEVPSVDDVLRAQGNVWEYLCQHLGVIFNDDTKKGVKQMLYALVFGSGITKKSALADAAECYFPHQQDVLNRFLAVPLIDELYQARKAAGDRVKREGGVVDAFGNWIDLPADRAVDKGVRSVLASQAQSYELRLLWPVIEEAMAGDDFAITVYLFDGLSLAFKDEQKRARILKRLVNKVDVVALELGIMTALDID